MKMPEDFIAESNRQKEYVIKGLYEQISQYNGMTPNDWPVTFTENLSSPRDFKRAVLIACALDDQFDCKLDNLESVRFRPYPSKYEGAWRIEVSFNRKGPYSGKEWYVNKENLWIEYSKYGEP